MRYMNYVINEQFDGSTRRIDNERYKSELVDFYILLKKPRSFLARDWQSGIKKWWNYYQPWLWQIAS